jgi:arsenate reductase
MKIFHNPRCRKSRETLAILHDKNKEPEIIEYLNNPPNVKELKEILSMLNIQAHDLIRTGEAIYKEQFKGKTLNNDQWIEAMIENPKLIERPIVISGNKAVIGRPPEKVLEIIDPS